MRRTSRSRRLIAFQHALAITTVTLSVPTHVSTLETSSSQASCGRWRSRYRGFRPLRRGPWTVAAQNKAVARQDLAVGGLEFRIVEHANGPGDHVAPRPGPRLFLGEQSAIDQTLHFRMIVTDLDDDAVADQIDPAVAGPYAGTVVAKDQDRRHGGTDHGVAGSSADLLKFAIGIQHPVVEAGKQIGSRAAQPIVAAASTTLALASLP